MHQIKIYLIFRSTEKLQTTAEKDKWRKGNAQLLSVNPSPSPSSSSSRGAGAAPFAACQALACDFESGNPCAYNLRALLPPELTVDGTAVGAWKLGSGPVGNPHTGVQKAMDNKKPLKSTFYYAKQIKILTLKLVFN